MNCAQTHHPSARLLLGLPQRVSRYSIFRPGKTAAVTISMTGGETRTTGSIESLNDRIRHPKMRSTHSMSTDNRQNLPVDDFSIYV
jgi:hypothetical protein